MKIKILRKAWITLNNNCKVVNILHLKNTKSKKESKSEKKIYKIKKKCKKKYKTFYNRKKLKLMNKKFSVILSRAK